MAYYYVMFLIASEKEYRHIHRLDPKVSGTTNPNDVDLTKLSVFLL